MLQPARMPGAHRQKDPVTLVGGITSAMGHGQRCWEAMDVGREKDGDELGTQVMGAGETWLESMVVRYC